MKYYLKLIIFFLLLSCNDNGIDNSFDYRELFSNYEIAVAKSESFGSIYDIYYVDNGITIQDTVLPSFYLQLCTDYNNLKKYLNNDKKIEYFWDDDILNTTYATYFDTINCDCNLVIIYDDDNSTYRTTMCFLKEKILSTVNYFDFKENELHWLIKGNMPNYKTFDELPDEVKELLKNSE